ncbi:MAG: HEPN domain-containing protein [Syntrophomonadaceae bacterium]|nr:HEPN domain-containing protein [Syntrophomonadaceae bacterium]
MDNKDRFSHWEEYAQYDLDTAGAMFDAGKYLYAVFMCQQAVEKIVKGIYVLYTGEEPARTHNIALVFNNLCEREEFRKNLTAHDFDRRKDECTSVFVRLLAFYISARYPTYKEKLTTMLTKVETQEIIDKTRETFAWVQSLKKFLV